MAKSRYTRKQVEDALRAAGGFVTQAAKTLGCHYITVLRYIDKSEHLQEVQAEVKESYLDLAEYNLLTLMKGDPKKGISPHLGAICFYLKCKGKDRGYVERQIIRSEGGLLIGEDPAHPIMGNVGAELLEMFKKMAKGKYKAPKKIEAPVLNEGEED